MNPLGGSTVQTIGVVLRGDSSSFIRSLGTANSATKAFESGQKASLSRWSLAWKVAGASVGLVLIGLAVGLTASAVAAAQFEARMRNVTSLMTQAGDDAHATDADFKSMSNSVLELARVVPQSANQLADGLYDVTSSGFTGAQSLLVLKAAAVSASAGMTDTATSVTAITAVLNAYGLSAASANDVSDILFQTVNKGVITFEELSGVLGSVVGIASAAKVPIEDVSAAIATMTLSGVSTAEAGTSLNRLIQGLIQPSDTLANLYKKLGYESGASALEQKGLAGVMEDIRQVTGGSVTAYLALFPEIRATRAAFALAANDGKIYASVQHDIGDANDRTGATQRAFDEQMKATSNQWKVLTAGLQANAIAIGSQVLPAFSELLKAGQVISNEFVPTMEAAGQAISPFLSSLYQAGVNVVAILEAMWQAAEPVAAALAKIAAAGVLTALNLLGHTLKALTGFLAENKGVTVALAGLYLSRFLPSITAIAAGLVKYGTIMRTQVLLRLIEWRSLQMQANLQVENGTRIGGAFRAGLGLTRGALAATATAARGMGAAMLASGVGTAALTAGIGLLVYAASTADQGVKQSIDDITSGVNKLDAVSLENSVKQMTDLRDSINEVAGVTTNKFLLMTGPIGGAIEGVKGLTNAWDQYTANKQIEAANDALGDQIQLQTNAIVNTRKISEESGVAFDEIQKIASGQGIDLTAWDSTDEAKAARDQVISYMEDMEKQSGVSTAVMNQNFQFSAEEMDAFAKAVQDAQEKVRAAFAGDTDVLGNWKPDIGVKETKDALEKLKEAQAELAKLRKDSKSTDDQIAAGRKRVSDAEDNYEEAKKKKREGTLKAWYTRALTTTQAFSDNITKAIDKGLDPAIVAKLLQEGPEQAGPIVEALVKDSSGKMIDMVNSAESALSDISGRIVEQARLTAVAVNSASSQASHDLAAAMDISTLVWSGKVTSVQDVAKRLGMSKDDVRRINDEFGLQLTDELGRTEPIKVPFTMDHKETQAEQGIFSGNWTGGTIAVPFTLYPVGAAADQKNGLFSGNWNGQIPGHAMGAVIPGYTPGRDTHIIRVGGGEAIMRPEWTAAVGGKPTVDYWNYLARTGSMAALRQAMMPYLGAFAGGGVAGAAPTMVPYPVEQRFTDMMPVAIAHATFTDPKAAAQYGRDRRRRGAWTGRR